MKQLDLPTIFYGDDQTVSGALREVVTEGVNRSRWQALFAQLELAQPLSDTFYLLARGDSLVDPRPAWRLYWLVNILQESTRIQPETWDALIPRFIEDGISFPWFALATFSHLRKRPLVGHIFAQDRHVARQFLDRYLAHFSVLYSIRHLFATENQLQIIPFYPSLKECPIGAVEFTIWHPLYYLMEYCQCAPIPVSEIFEERDRNSFDMQQMLLRANLWSEGK
jgi:hypothetical protein